MPIYFRHLEGSKKGEVEFFDLPRIRIGRLPNNDLRFDLQKDREMSGSHAEVYSEGRDFVIKDLDSTNGTYVNGQRIQEPASISDGDVIQFSSRGPKVVFLTRDPGVGTMQTLNLEAPPVGTLLISEDQPGALGVGAKTLRRMIDEAVRDARSSKSGRFRASASFVRQILTDASTHFSRRIRWTFASIILLLAAVNGALVFLNHQKQKELDVLEQKQQRQLELIAKQHAELEKLRGVSEELKGKGIEAQETGRGVLVSLPNVFFEIGRYDLTPEGVDAVKKIGAVIKESAPGRKILVEGHASREKGEQEKANQQLSEERARKIAEALVSYGVAKDRITFKGLGSSRQVASNDTEEGRRKNRRVEVIIEK